MGLETSEPAEQGKAVQVGEKRRVSVLVFACLAALWLALDVASKSLFNTAYAPGDVITEPIAGLFRFRLVHNTGAAWGMFGDSTFALGIMSVVVCVALLAYLIVASKDMNLGQVIGLALVFAGGIGNALDRFTLGYVVDFVDFTFIDFPVFNVADIGVTCGFVIFIASMLYAWRKADKHAAAASLADSAIDSDEDDADSEVESKKSASEENDTRSNDSKAEGPAAR